MTFDIEEWYHAEIPRRHLNKIPNEVTNIEHQISIIVDICAKYDIKATCFIVGELARVKPHLVKKLYNSGHEIASHSYKHRLVYEMTPEEFAEDLRNSCDILQQIIGDKVIGFRASSWSVNASCARWYYACLRDQGIKYSSSVFPGTTFLYGMAEAPQEPYWIKGTDVLEIPQELIRMFNKKIGFAGGFCFRFLPYFFIKNVLVRKMNQGKVVFMYFHPWEFKKEKYPLKLNILEHIIHYWGIKNNLGKLENILKSKIGLFGKMKDYYYTILKENRWNEKEF